MNKKLFHQKEDKSTNLLLGIIAVELAIVAVVLFKIYQEIAAATSTGTVRPPAPPPKKELDVIPGR